MENFFVEYLVPGSMWMTGFCAVLAIIVPIVIALMQDPKSLIKGLGGVAILAIIFFVSRAMAKAELPDIYVSKYDVTTASLSQSIGGSLTMTYALLGVSLVLIVFSEVSKIFK